MTSSSSTSSSSSDNSVVFKHENLVRSTHETVKDIYAKVRATLLSRGVDPDLADVKQYLERVYLGRRARHQMYQRMVDEFGKQVLYKNKSRGACVGFIAKWAAGEARRIGANIPAAWEDEEENNQGPDDNMDPAVAPAANKQLAAQLRVAQKWAKYRTWARGYVGVPKQINNKAVNPFKIHQEVVERFGSFEALARASPEERDAGIREIYRNSEHVMAHRSAYARFRYLIEILAEFDKEVLAGTTSGGDDGGDAPLQGEAMEGSGEDVGGERKGQVLRVVSRFEAKLEEAEKDCHGDLKTMELIDDIRGDLHRARRILEDVGRTSILFLGRYQVGKTFLWNLLLFLGNESEWSYDSSTLEVYDDLIADAAADEDLEENFENELPTSRAEPTTTSSSSAPSSLAVETDSLPGAAAVEAPTAFEILLGDGELPVDRANIVPVVPPEGLFTEEGGYAHEETLEYERQALKMMRERARGGVTAWNDFIFKERGDNIPGFLLLSAETTNKLSTTMHECRVRYGKTWHFAVTYFSEKELRAMIGSYNFLEEKRFLDKPRKDDKDTERRRLEFGRMISLVRAVTTSHPNVGNEGEDDEDDDDDDDEPKARPVKAARASEFPSFLPKDDTECGKDLVFHPDVLKVAGRTFVFAGRGQHSLDDRVYVRRMLHGALRVGLGRPFPHVPGTVSPASAASSFSSSSSSSSSSSYGAKQGPSPNIYIIKRLTVYAPCMLLGENSQFVDVPGSGDDKDERTMALVEALAQASGVIILSEALYGGSETARRVFENIVFPRFVGDPRSKVAYFLQNEKNNPHATIERLVSDKVRESNADIRQNLRVGVRRGAMEQLRTQKVARGRWKNVKQRLERCLELGAWSVSPFLYCSLLANNEIRLRFEEIDSGIDNKPRSYRLLSEVALERSNGRNMLETLLYLSADRALSASVVLESSLESAHKAVDKIGSWPDTTYKAMDSHIAKAEMLTRRGMLRKEFERQVKDTSREDPLELAASVLATVLDPHTTNLVADFAVAVGEYQEEILMPLYADKATSPIEIFSALHKGTRHSQFLPVEFLQKTAGEIRLEKVLACERAVASALMEVFFNDLEGFLNDCFVSGNKEEDENIGFDIDHFADHDRYPLGLLVKEVFERCRFAYPPADPESNRKSEDERAAQIREEVDKAAEARLLEWTSKWLVKQAVAAFAISSEDRDKYSLCVGDDKRREWLDAHVRRGLALFRDAAKLNERLIADLHTRFMGIALREKGRGPLDSAHDERAVRRQRRESYVQDGIVPELLRAMFDGDKSVLLGCARHFIQRIKNMRRHRSSRAEFRIHFPATIGSLLAQTKSLCARMRRSAVSLEKELKVKFVLDGMVDAYPAVKGLLVAGEEPISRSSAHFPSLPDDQREVLPIDTLHREHEGVGGELSPERTVAGALMLPLAENVVSEYLVKLAECVFSRNGRAPYDIPPAPTATAMSSSSSSPTTAMVVEPTSPPSSSSSSSSSDPTLLTSLFAYDADETDENIAAANARLDAFLQTAIVSPRRLSVQLGMLQGACELMRQTFVLEDTRLKSAEKEGRRIYVMRPLVRREEWTGGAVPFLGLKLDGNGFARPSGATGGVMTMDGNKARLWWGDPRELMKTLAVPSSGHSQVNSSSSTSTASPEKLPSEPSPVAMAKTAPRLSTATTITIATTSSSPAPVSSTSGAEGGGKRASHSVAGHGPAKNTTKRRKKETLFSMKQPRMKADEFVDNEILLNGVQYYVEDWDPYTRLHTIRQVGNDKRLKLNLIQQGNRVMV